MCKSARILLTVSKPKNRLQIAGVDGWQPLDLGKFVRYPRDEADVEDPKVDPRLLSLGVLQNLTSAQQEYLSTEVERAWGALVWARNEVAVERIIDASYAARRPEVSALVNAARRILKEIAALEKVIHGMASTVAVYPLRDESLKIAESSRILVEQLVRPVPPKQRTSPTTKRLRQTLDQQRERLIAVFESFGLGVGEAHVRTALIERKCWGGNVKVGRGPFDHQKVVSAYVKGGTRKRAKKRGSAARPKARQ